MLREHQHHTFPPVYNERSSILILGSFPSVKSRELGFYYGYPRNRFWQVLAALTASPVPETVEAKKKLLLSNGVALWDVIDSCQIHGSSDSSIRDVVPCPVDHLLEKTQIRSVYTNGNTADRLYRKYLFPRTGIEATVLPSTSPANAAWTLERLIERWRTCIQLSISTENITE